MIARKALLTLIELRPIEDQLLDSLSYRVTGTLALLFSINRNRRHHIAGISLRERLP